MIISPDISSKLAIDARSIDELQVLAKRNPDNALQKVAQGRKEEESVARQSPSGVQGQTNRRTPNLP